MSTTKLTTNQIISLFNALSELRGIPSAVPDGRGGTAVVFEPYDLGPKFIWNAAKDRNILRRHIEDHDEQVREFKVGLNKLRRELAASKDNPEENKQRLLEETERVNDEIRKLSKAEIEVDGLLKLPASGLNLRTSKVPPPLIEELMPLIEGEPDVGDPK